MYTLIALLYSALLFPSFALTVINQPDEIRYDPNWKSLDSRPLPVWYDEAKIGIFIHWGVFSVPSFGSEWFWSNWKGNSEDYVNFMKNNYPENFSYQEFAKDFTAEFFNATQWAEILASSGAKYVVLTSKHHEGFTLWPSNYAYSWNSKDIGPHRDIVGELSNAVRAEGLTFGTYYSLYEWFHPLYHSDKASNYTKNEFVYHKVLPEIHELIENYKVSILWSDGDWEAPDSYWNSTELLAWLYNDSPVKDVVVVNDRWGMNIPCHHGDFYTCTDRYNPGTLQPHKWENAMTIDRKSWGFRRNARLADYFTINELLAELASTISCRGNFLMNIGPTSYGTIPPIFEERLQQMGQWLAINGEGIYGSQPWTSQNDTITEGVWYTSKGNTVYAIILDWKNNVLLGSVVDLFVNEKPVVEMLGNKGSLNWSVDQSTSAVNIRLHDRNVATSQWAWVLKIVPSSNDVI